MLDRVKDRIKNILNVFPMDNYTVDYGYSLAKCVWVLSLYFLLLLFFFLH